MAAEALFSRIADDLRRQIVTGELAPGERLPTEHDLAARYSTTRATVRKALAVLRSEGRIDSSQGSGSYIKRRAPILMQSTGAVRRSRRRSGAPNFNAEMTARGLEARQELLRVDTITAAPEIAAQLGLDEDTEVIVGRLMFTVEG
ncbi:GntR family transcriptional regulator [Nonomuraea roseola]|uniref:GntR family transcriptional regulator n=1 Tax=Nonomuraea roseola TaxID=46179 RepID=A0ABV5PW09_9ACTN